MLKFSLIIAGIASLAASAMAADAPSLVGQNYLHEGELRTLENVPPAQSKASANPPSRSNLTRADVLPNDGPLQSRQRDKLKDANIQIQSWYYLDSDYTPATTPDAEEESEVGEGDTESATTQPQVHPHIVGGYNIYSPFLITQTNPETNVAELVMYFSGWLDDAALTDGTDTLYRTVCEPPFGPCQTPEPVISHTTHAELQDGRYLYQLADPTIVKLNDSTNTGRDFYLLYVTVTPCESAEPAVCKAQMIERIQNGTFFEEEQMLYYATSWVEDGLNWSKLYPLPITRAWLPSAVAVDDSVYLYANSTEDGAIYRYELGPDGVTPVDSGQAVEMLDELGNPIVWGVTNVNVAYVQGDEETAGFYQILVERFPDQAAWDAQKTQIDYFQSADGLTWEMAMPAAVTPQAGAHRVGTPAPHPDTPCFVYFGENPEIPADTPPARAAAYASLDFNIYGYDWCTPIINRNTE